MARIVIRMTTLPEATDAQLVAVARLIRNIHKLSKRDQRRIRKVLRIAYDTLKLTEN